MRARAQLLAALLVALPVAALAEPKPKAVDIKAYKDKLIVLRDAAGGTYVVMSERNGDAHLFYGATGKPLYEQIVMNRSFNETGFDVHVLAPRVAEMRDGSVLRRPDGTYSRFCGNDDTPLTQVTGDKAKAVLEKSSFMSPALVRRAHLLARDDHGVYYYIDAIRDMYGGKGYRVFVGRKGAMKELPLVDIATDSAGQVFATKTGELRLVTRTGDDANAQGAAYWVKGEAKTTLISLDTAVNSPIIYNELGIYSFTGTICEQ